MRHAHGVVCDFERQFQAACKARVVEACNITADDDDCMVAVPCTTTIFNEQGCQVCEPAPFQIKVTAKVWNAYDHSCCWWEAKHCHVEI
jgi:Tfp pilus assembly protein PilX